MLWYIALGSALGGMGRYLLGLAIQRGAGTVFPLGTLVINVLGSLVLGFLFRLGAGAGAGAGLTPEARAFLGVGLCGGFTTFSTFSLDTAMLLEDGEWARASLYVGLSVGLSLAAAVLGMALARELGVLRRGL